MHSIPIPGLSSFPISFGKICIGDLSTLVICTEVHIPKHAKNKVWNVQIMILLILRILLPWSILKFTNFCWNWLGIDNYVRQFLFCKQEKKVTFFTKEIYHEYFLIFHFIILGKWLMSESIQMKDELWILEHKF